MVALTVVLASVVFYLVLSFGSPQNFTKTSMKIMPFNSTTLGVTSMIGDSIRIDNINILVGSSTYNASGIDDENSNGMWDPGETIYLYGLDLTGQNSVVVATHSQVLLSSNVPPHYSPAPSTPETPEGTFTSYFPGLHMTTYSDPAFMSPVNACIADNVTYACTESGYWTNDPAWPVSEAGSDHNFSVKFEGYLDIASEDAYEIRIMATDSVYLSIDGTRVINVAGSHGTSSWPVAINLTREYHTLEIGYQNLGSDAVIGDFIIRKQSDGIWMPPTLCYLESIDA